MNKAAGQETYRHADAGIWQAHVDILVFDLLVFNMGLEVSHYSV